MPVISWTIYLSFRVSTFCQPTCSAYIAAVCYHQSNVGLVAADNVTEIDVDVKCGNLEMSVFWLLFTSNPANIKLMRI